MEFYKKESGVRNLQSLSYPAVLFVGSYTFYRIDRAPACDERTDGHMATATALA